MRAEAPDSIRVSHSRAPVGKGGTQNLQFARTHRGTPPPGTCRAEETFVNWVHSENRKTTIF